MSGPALDEGFEVVVLPEGIAVVNGGAPVLFQGRAANEVLVPLIAVLDGTRDAAALAAVLDMPVEHVERGLALLAARQLLAPND